MAHRYLLDTNIIAALARAPGGEVAAAIAAVGERTICTSIIVACEVQYGLIKRASARLTKQMTAILGAVDIMDLPEGVAEHYGDIRMSLEKGGETIGPNDLLIAAHARAAGLVVVSGNEREFRRVPALEVENWLHAKA